MLSRYFVPVLSNNMNIQAVDANQPMDTEQKIRYEAVRANIGRPNVEMVVAIYGYDQVLRLLGPEEASKIDVSGNLDRKPEEKASREYKAYVPPGPDPVFAFILTPDGHPRGFLRTEEILVRGDRDSSLRAHLDEQIKRLGLREGAPLPAYGGQKPGKGEVVLHTVARYVGMPSYNGSDGESIVNSIVVFRQFPGEGWIHLPEKQWQCFLPPEDAKVGDSWSIVPAVANKFFIHCYPPTEASYPEYTKVVNGEMTAKLESQENGIAHVRLAASVHLKHPWWNRPDEEKYADTSFMGFVDVDTQTRQIKTFRMTTDGAHYYATDKTVEAPFGMAVTNI